MTLDDSLKQLHALEVGNVEVAIEGIEKAKVETQRTADTFEQELLTYRHLLKEKLPRIIGNIITLGGYVVELGNGFVRGLSVMKDGEIFRLRKNISIPYNPGEVPFQIFFDGKASVQNIFFGDEPKYWKEHWYSHRRLMEGGIINAKTPEEFTSKYVDLIMPDIRTYGESRYILLPSSLKEVPVEIMELYDQRRKSLARKFETLKSHNGNLSFLDVSDFR